MVFVNFSGCGLLFIDCFICLLGLVGLDWFILTDLVLRFGGLLLGFACCGIMVNVGGCL